MSTFSTPLSGFAFTTDPLERADPLRQDADALARLWPDAHVLVLDTDGRALAGDDGQPLALTGAQVGGKYPQHLLVLARLQLEAYPQRTVRLGG